MQRQYKLLIVSFIALVTLGLMWLDGTHMNIDDDSNKTRTANQQVPNVAFTLLNGKTVSLHSLQGHTVWLHFWASWCAPCRQEFPELLQRIQKSDGKIILLAVSADERPEDARNFIAPLQKDFPKLFTSGQVLIADDPDRKLIEGVFQTFQYPETIVIGPDMAMTQKIVGMY